MTTHEILVAVRELLAVEERWTKGPARKDAWCLITALAKIGPGLNAISCPVQDYQKALRREIFGSDQGCSPTSSISIWQDAPERTHAEVLAVLDKAIEEAA